MGPGFQLVGIPSDPIIPGNPVSPVVLVGLNNAETQGGPIIPAVQYLDLSNPQAPEIGNAGHGDWFYVYWYMQSKSAITFNSFTPESETFSFNGTDLDYNIFAVTFTINGNHKTWKLLDVQPPAPEGFQGFMATFDPKFTIRGSLKFSVTENPSSTAYRAPLSFQPVPVPGAVWLFGSGLLGLVGLRWRRKSG